MPIYEYACTACGERTEAKQSFDDPPLETCRYCRGNLRKLYSPVGIVFKGSGFYSTDAKKSSTTTDSKKKPEPDKKSAPADSKATSSSTTESKSSDTTAK